MLQLNYFNIGCKMFTTLFDHSNYMQAQTRTLSLGFSTEVFISLVSAARSDQFHDEFVAN
jgi:hypothetical protein